jgi:hypothetical protein
MDRTTGVLARATLLGLMMLTATAGLGPLALASLPATYLQIPRPPVTLRQCERGGGVVQAQSSAKLVCVGGLYNGSRVTSE